MDKKELEIGDIVQLNPSHKLAGCFVIVTEPKSWGCQGYLAFTNFERIPNLCTVDGRAFIRPKFEDFEYCGKAFWIRDNQENENV